MNRKTEMKTAVALSLVLVTNILTSCQRDFDYYNPDYVKQQYEKSWENTFGEIDSKQDWSMVTKATVSITPDEAGTVYVYDSDPLSKVNTPKCMLKMATDGTATINTVIDIDKELDCVYVALYNEAGYLRVIPAVVENGSVTVSFVRSSAAKSSAKKTASVSRTDVTYSWLTDELKATIAKGEVTIPDDIKNIEDVTNFDDVTSCYVTTDYTKWIGKAGLSLYIKGENVTLTSLDANTWTWDGTTGRNVGPTIYVLPDSKLTIKSSSKITNGTVIYVAPGANLDIDGGRSLSNLYIWNQGTTTVTGDLAFTGSSSFVNDDGGSVTVSGTTIINSTTTQWVNDGSWTTQDMSITSASSAWINGCHLVVNGTLSVDLGDGSPETANLRVDGGASIVTKILDFEHGTIYEGANSLIKVTEEAKFGSFHSNTGIIGPTTGNAVLQMKKATQINAKQGYSICYHYNLYVACNDHFANDCSGQYPYIYIDGAQMMGETNAPISIQKSACNPGYNSTTVSEPTSEAVSYIFACEDLGSTDDYDFNDIIFSVSYIQGQENAVVKVLAAGGVLEANLSYKTDTRNVAIGEVHKRLGASGYVMLNTNEVTNVDEGYLLPVLEDNWSLADHLGDFKVSVNTGYVTADGSLVQNEISKYLTAGSAPQVIVLRGDWEWPVERTRIDAAYPDFPKWSANAEDLEWIKTKVSGSCVSR
jgi:hypothetical protein